MSSGDFHETRITQAIGEMEQLANTIRTLSEELSQIKSIVEQIKTTSDQLKSALDQYKKTTEETKATANALKEDAQAIRADFDGFNQKVRRLPLDRIIIICTVIALIIGLILSRPFSVAFSSTSDLPAYSVVTNANVRKTIRWIPPDGAIRKLEDATVIQATTMAVPRDTVITNDMLVALPRIAATWNILTIPGSP